MREILPEELLSRPGFALLDVRAEIEFADGHLPGSRNLPLLRTAERHEVGIVYKREGQDAAVALGHRLVDPHRNERVRAWAAYLNETDQPVLTCARGGLRSQIAQRWLAEAGVTAARVRGGYKMLRRALLRQFEMPLRGFVVTGLTGSNKTGFVRSVGSPRAVDLERLAVHRGSAFGGLFQPGPQPAQQTFENAIGLALLQNRAGGDFLFEDESRLVGRCVLPAPFFDGLRALPRIFLESSEDDRVSHILEEYVEIPLRSLPAERVVNDLVGALRTLRGRLGGLAADEIERGVRAAFAGGDHRGWVTRLLREYYDRLYEHAMDWHGAKPVFRGTAGECREWLRANSDLFRW